MWELVKIWLSKGLPSGFFPISQLLCKHQCIVINIMYYACSTCTCCIQLVQCSSLYIWSKENVFRWRLSFLLRGCLLASVVFLPCLHFSFSLSSFLFSIPFSLFFPSVTTPSHFPPSLSPFSHPLPISYSLLSPSLSSLVVTINPLIPEVNISTYHIGAPITIGCPVQTCAEEVSVQFLRGDEVISVIESTSAAPTAYNLQLTVSEDIAGVYACKADTVNPDNSTIAHFNIVGK